MRARATKNLVQSLAREQGAKTEDPLVLPPPFLEANAPSIATQIWTIAGVSRTQKTSKQISSTPNKQTNMKLAVKIIHISEENSLLKSLLNIYVSSHPASHPASQPARLVRQICLRIKYQVSPSPLRTH